LSLVYAARFPGKVRKLVLAGAPIDIAAGQSELSMVAAATPLAMFRSLVSLGDGRVIGRNVAKFWRKGIVDTSEINRSLQTPEPAGSPEFARLEAAFRRWNCWTIDVPGNYYLEIIEKIYRRNELAGGSLIALGRTVDLAQMRVPTYLLAGNADDVVAPEQLLAAERLVGTKREHIRHDVAPSDHLGLFMGKTTLEQYWPRIARWLNTPELEVNVGQPVSTASSVLPGAAGGL
jgi:pimeloyl-ACP methyl ester carboxylesterase